MLTSYEYQIMEQNHAQCENNLMDKIQKIKSKVQRCPIYDHMNV